ncbi:MAG: 16S rRNA (guanine(966)-N(2))-methyltransferase RsmD [Pseudomonadota bacterium]
MRITAGLYKGRKLTSPKNTDVRPTGERVREAVFSTLGAAVKDSHVLDLFAGTGAFGLEALSRGALSVVLVEKDPRMVRAIGRTIAELQAEDAAVVLAMDVGRATSAWALRKAPFGLVFLDPPYDGDWVPRLMHDPAFIELIAEDGLLIVETRFRSPHPGLPDRLDKRFSRRYGDTLIEIFRRR